MKSKILGIEPFLTILSSWSFLEKVLLEPKSTYNSTLRMELQKTYPGELTYYFDFLIEEGVQKTEFQDLVENSLNQLDNLIFNKNSKIKNFQIYKLTSLWILKELLLFWHLNRKELPINRIRNEHLYQLPYYIRNLRDTHLHAGLAYDFVSLIEILTRRFEIFKRISEKLLNKGLLRKRVTIVNEKLKLQYRLFRALKCEEEELSENEIKSLIFKLKEGIPQPTPSYTDDFRIFEFLKLIAENLQSKNNKPSKKLTAAVAVVNLNSLLQENTDRSAYLGLQYFSDEFLKRNPIKRVGNILPTNLLVKAYREFFKKERQVVGFELRMFPNKRSFTAWSNLIDNLKDTYKEFSLIFHFSKASNWKKIERIENFYTDTYRRCKDFANFLKKKPELIKLLNGIDAASKEYWTPAWAFAPLYSFWRHYAIHYIEELRERAEPIKFTFHAGEDFIELSAGLKSIYEAIFFLELKSGDRIGHGLALAVEPKSYSIRFRNVRNSYLYYFFTLLWLNYLSFAHLEIKDYKESIIKEIEWVAEEVESVRNLIRDLREIWNFELHTLLVRLYECLKFDFVNYEDSYFFELWSAPYDGNIFFKNSRSMIRNFFRSYREEKKYRSLEVYLDPLFRRESSIPFEEQVELLKRIQSLVLNQVIEKGIVIEACPSSNLLIRGLLDCKEHLVVKLKDYIKERKLRVSLNTDNPLTFSTTLTEEYMLVNEALPEEDREPVITSLVETGNLFKFGESLESRWRNF